MPAVVGIATLHARVVRFAPTQVHPTLLVLGAPAAASAIQSCAPPNPFASVTVTVAAGATVDALTASVAGGSYRERQGRRGRPVWPSALRIVPTLAPGTASLDRLHVPATCGAAIEVPVSDWNVQTAFRAVCRRHVATVPLHTEISSVQPDRYFF